MTTDPARETKPAAPSRAKKLLLTVATLLLAAWILTLLILAMRF